MTPFVKLNWTVNNSVEAAKGEGRWQTGGLCSEWSIANSQLLHHRNSVFDFVHT